MSPEKAPARPRRILVVFAWLMVGGEETEVRLLAKHLDPARYTIDVVACLRRPGMPEQTHRQLADLGVQVDRTPYALSFEDTVAYLAVKIARYDLVVACQGVPDIHAALDLLPNPPPLIEHGGLVSEVTATPKRHTTRYVGVCASIRAAAAAAMPERPQHALEIPSMVDLAEFDPGARGDAPASSCLITDRTVIYLNDQASRPAGGTMATTLATPGENTFSRRSTSAVATASDVVPVV